MKAARVHELGKIVIEDVPIPELKEKEVLIAVHRAGICGTDVGVVDGHVSAKYPVTLGHEFSGTIAKLGNPSLTSFKEGDPVVSGGGWGCGECELCHQGLGLYCKNRFSLGRNTDGCMAEFVKVDYRVVQKIPQNVSFDEAQNTVNIACSLRAVKKIDLRKVKTAAVFGPGNAGLIILQLLKMGGVDQVVMVGTRDFRLDVAKSFGSAAVVNVKRVFESSGTAKALESAFSVVKSNGSIVVFGIISEKMKEFDPSFLYYKEPIIYGSKGSSGDYTETVKLLEEKKLKILPMITHRFPLDETAKAFKVFEDKISDALRIVIDVRP
jgi:threonine dehydrogenase-like Zn-dependent dehydrogenase